MTAAALIPGLPSAPRWRADPEGGPVAVSLKAMNWVWDHSPAAGTELLVLLAIADNADDTGANAFPAAATLARKTRLDARTVRRVIRRLEDDGRLVVDRSVGGRAANRYAVPLTTPSHPVDNSPNPGDEASTPLADCQGWQIATPGVGATPGVAQLRHRRGGTATPPEPSYNRPRTPTPRAGSGTTAGADAETSPAGGGGEPVAEVFDALGPAWRLSPAQHARLAPGVAGALAAGWSPAALAELLSANPHGVRSAVAVLESRLADLPPVEAPEPARPAWCGGCDEHSRHRETAAGAAYRCPTCHPLAAS
ncbi:MAG: hypothetical protein GEU83_14350 [Pseudonocardiaceae bacterium]|nr:hypothetical protein [Pseudonocardiaceae bacterium]